MKKSLTLLLALACLAGLSGCGKTGPLYLPDAPTKNPTEN